MYKYINIGGIVNGDILRLYHGINYRCCVMHKDINIGGVVNRNIFSQCHGIN